MNEAAAEKSRVSQKAVLATSAALLFLWAASFGLSFVALGAFALPVALAIAVLKAALVALFFMELAGEALSIRMTLSVALALALILGGLMVADILTRDRVGDLRASRAGARLAALTVPEVRVDEANGWTMRLSALRRAYPEVSTSFPASPRRVSRRTALVRRGNHRTQPGSSFVHCRGDCRNT